MKRRIFIFITVCALIAPLYTGGVFIAYAGIVDELQQQIEEREKEIERLRQQAREFEQNALENSKYAGTLEEQIQNFNYEINRLRTNINIKENEVYKAELTIRSLEFEITRRETEMEIRRDQMTELLQEIYQNDEEGLVEVMFRYNNLSNFFSQVQARDSLQNGISGELDVLRRIRTELEQDIIGLNVEQEQLRLDQDVLVGQRAVIEGKRGQQRELLAQTRDEQHRYEQMVAEIEEREREMQLEIFRLEDQLRRTLDPNSVPNPREGVLGWPISSEWVLKSYNPTQPYGCLTTSWARRSYPPCPGGGFHNGLDYAAPLGAPILAAENGTVVARGNAPYAYGLWLVIRHENGLLTAYTHMSNYAAQVGQSIKRGETIGYMGSSGFSTGSHIHFMVYAPDTFIIKQSSLSGTLPIGATLNPAEWLGTPE